MTRRDPRWLTWFWIAGAILPCALAVFFFLTDTGAALAEALRSVP